MSTRTCKACNETFQHEKRGRPPFNCPDCRSEKKRRPRKAKEEASVVTAPVAAAPVVAPTQENTEQRPLFPASEYTRFN